MRDAFFLQKEDTRANKASELSLANVGGVFVVLLAGMGLACLIAVFEFIWKSRKLASSENVRHSSLVAKALSHTNENMFYVPKRLDRQLVVKNAPVAIAMALAASYQQPPIDPQHTAAAQHTFPPMPPLYNNNAQLRDGRADPIALSPTPLTHLHQRQLQLCTSTAPPPTAMAF